MQTSTPCSNRKGLRSRLKEDLSVVGCRIRSNLPTPEMGRSRESSVVSKSVVGTNLEAEGQRANDD